MKMKTTSLALLIISLLLIGGCSSKIEQIAAQTTQVMEAPIDVPEAVERLLDAGFRDSNEPWEIGSAELVAKTRSAIESTQDYQKAKLSFDNSLPYSDVKSGFLFVQYQYNLLERELNKRRDMPGVLSEETQVIYWYACKDIHAQMKKLQLKIAATEAGINEKADQDTINQLKSVYAVVKPMLSTVM